MRDNHDCISDLIPSVIVYRGENARFWLILEIDAWLNFMSPFCCSSKTTSNFFFDCSMRRWAKSKIVTDLPVATLYNPKFEELIDKIIEDTTSFTCTKSLVWEPSPKIVKWLLLLMSDKIW